MNSPNTSPPRQSSSTSTPPRLPDPGLIIRTSGGVRLSGFLLWQCINSEFYFTDVYWPEFREVDFLPRFARSSRGRDALGSEAGDQIKALEPR
jgi:undecaprenyl diphosphate synthase